MNKIDEWVDDILRSDFIMGALLSGAEANVPRDEWVKCIRCLIVRGIEKFRKEAIALQKTVYSEEGDIGWNAVDIADLHYLGTIEEEARQ